MNPPKSDPGRVLPVLQVQRPELHENAAILEVSEMTQLVELASTQDPAYLLARLSDTVALIDPGTGCLAGPPGRGAHAKMEEGSA